MKWIGVQVDPEGAKVVAAKKEDMKHRASEIGWQVSFCTFPIFMYQIVLAFVDRHLL